MKIFFDFDGTIVDTSEGIINAALFAFKKYGYNDFSLNDLKSKLIGPPLHKGLKQLTQLPEEEVEKLVLFFREYYSSQGVFQNNLYKDIVDVLQYLKQRKYSLNIASSKPERFIIKILKQHNIKDFFDYIGGAKDNDKKSTKTEKIKNLINGGSRKYFMIGDRAEDIEAGKKNEIFTIGVLYGYGSLEELEKAGADYLVYKPKDIIKIIEGV